VPGTAVLVVCFLKDSSQLAAGARWKRFPSDVAGTMKGRKQLPDIILEN